MSERTLWQTQYGPIVPRSIFANLLKDVIRAGKCIGCGTCVAVCPVSAITMIDEIPRLSAMCIRCGYCYYSCPITTDKLFSGFDNLKRDELSKIFGDNYNEGPYGYYRSIYKCDGEKSILNIIKSIMRFLLQNNYIDLIATSGFNNLYANSMVKLSNIIPNPLLISSVDELDNLTLWITTSPSGVALRIAVDEFFASFFQASYIPKICYFAAPTHVRAIWRMRLGWGGNIKIAEPIYLTITVFGNKYYTLQSIKDALSKMNIDVSEIKKYLIDGDNVVFKLKSGDEINISLQQVEGEIHQGINNLNDKYGNFADLSIGMIDDEPYIIVRSVKAEKIINEFVKAKYLQLKHVEIKGIRGDSS